MRLVTLFYAASSAPSSAASSSSSTPSSATRDTHDARQGKEEERRHAEVTEKKGSTDEVEVLKVKKRKIETNIKALLVSADKLAMEAEAPDKMSVLSQSNALRKAAKVKEHELVKYDQKLEQKMNVM
ncbi:UNVERIFIED_CONTAM: hypothetical protein FKN15_037485 [Acipenser sinensis]